MAKPPTVIATPHTHSARGILATIFFSVTFIFTTFPVMAEPPLPENQSLFLVATEQLEHTSFHEAVILITHHSERGATGLTINRPTDIPLTMAFPHVPQFKQRNDLLYLGGPVSTNAIFFLLRTNQPNENMHRIAKNIYFSTAQNALTHPSTNDSRTYAGYVGWAPGQLQTEINRGDWLLIHTEPGIIFEKNTDEIWQRLSKQWSGQWL